MARFALIGGKSMHSIWCLVLACLMSAAAVPDDAALYRQRFAAMMRDGGVVTHYDPMEAVPGARRMRALPAAPAGARSIRAAALNAATACAAANRSRAFPVADFIPEWKGSPKAAILIRNLLDMRSGLMEHTFSTNP